MRLFACRKAQAWPPTVNEQTGWDSLYAEQASGLPVLQSMEEALVWANDFVKKIGDA